MNFKKCPKWFFKKQSQIDTKHINWILVGLSSSCTLTRDEGVVGFDSKINRGTNSSKWRLLAGENRIGHCHVTLERSKRDRRAAESSLVSVDSTLDNCISVCVSISDRALLIRRCLIESRLTKSVRSENEIRITDGHFISIPNIGRNSLLAYYG